MDGGASLATVHGVAKMQKHPFTLHKMCEPTTTWAFAPISLKTTYQGLQ